VGEQGTLSKTARREHKKRRAVTIQLEGEGSKKTLVPEREALEEGISDF